jgi:hypothetical protein
MAASFVNPTGVSHSPNLTADVDVDIGVGVDNDIDIGVGVGFELQLVGFNGTRGPKKRLIVMVLN